LAVESPDKDVIMPVDTSRWLLLRHNSLASFAVALAAVVTVLFIGWFLAPFYGNSAPYIAVCTGIAFSAWYCGLRPSILAAVLSLLGLKYFFIPPVHSLALGTTKQGMAGLLLVAAFAVIIGIGEVRRRENEALRQAQGHLEDRVQQRTAELDNANDSLRQLSASLMQLQDDERRRIARELHDSVGQTLAALAMNLTTVGADIERLNRTSQIIADSATLVQEMNQEVRTISYLLHPPLLDEAGLVSALRWYIDGFAQRSKIGVDLEVDEDFGRLSREVETGIFRTVQECLTNIHRHSGSLTANIRLQRDGSGVRLKVQDSGAGMAVEQLDSTAGTPGVGIRGMRERLRQLGGTLEISSNGHGTLVEVHVPASNSSTAAA
jgi:signal transduction histidine kinase